MNRNSEIQSDLFMIAKTPLLLDPHLTLRDGVSLLVLTGTASACLRVA